MIYPGLLNGFQEKITDLEVELHNRYKHRDRFPAGSTAWKICQQHITERRKRLAYLYSVFERMKDETLPEAAWGFTTSHAA